MLILILHIAWWTAPKLSLYPLNIKSIQWKDTLNRIRIDFSSANVVYTQKRSLFKSIASELDDASYFYAMVFQKYMFLLKHEVNTFGKFELNTFTMYKKTIDIHQCGCLGSMSSSFSSTKGSQILIIISSVRV